MNSEYRLLSQEEIEQNNKLLIEEILNRFIFFRRSICSISASTLSQIFGLPNLQSDNKKHTHLWAFLNSARNQFFIVCDCRATKLYSEFNPSLETFINLPYQWFILSNVDSGIKEFLSVFEDYCQSARSIT